MSRFHVDVAVRIRSILTNEIDQSLDQSTSQSINYSINDVDGRITLAISTPKTSKASTPIRPSIRQSIKQVVNQSSVLSTLSVSDQSAKQPTDQSTKSYRGFASVLDQSATNIDVYNTVLKPLVDRVLQGETACCFAYGHTGSGKTHTIVGYNDELGLYRHAVEALTRSINQSINQSNNQMLQVRCCELYQGKVYDLLADHAECFLREDASGQVHIRSATELAENGQVRVRSLRAAYANQTDDVNKLVQLALANRAVGNSSIHSQSSRSHAMIELQLVTPQVIEAREAVLEAEAKLVPIGKARDGMYIDIMSRCCYPDPDRKGAWIQDLTRVPDSEHAELEKLQQQVAEAEELLKQARQNEQNAVDDGTSMLPTANQSNNQSDNQSNDQSNDQPIDQSNDPVRRDCPTLVLVDLAGAEYATVATTSGGTISNRSTKRSTQELAEGKEINSSLLALKECMRALSSNSSHVPFRNSKLTLLLRRYLRCQAASAVMIATVSPSSSQAAATANTLQYAALLTDTK